MNEENVIDLKEYMDMIKSYDIDTANHCKRVSRLCKLVAQMTNYDKSKELEHAALVHDIGKILIPKEILNKRSKLDRLEKLIINSHAHWGFEILSTSNMKDIEKLFVLYHHGFIAYPQSIYNISNITTCVDNDVLEGSIILQACDVYDAVTSKRPYHRPQSPETAYQALYDKHIPERIINCLKILAIKQNTLNYENVM